MNHVMTQTKQQTLSFIVCRCCRGLGRTVARKFSIGELYVCGGWLDILKLTNTPLIYNVSCFSLGGLGASFGGLSRPKIPSGDGTGFGFRTCVIKLSLSMYSFSISIDEHVPLKFLLTKRLWQITRM